jgi:hypothetical protein
MNRRRSFRGRGRPLTGALVALLLTLVVAACGNEVPPNSVAQVDDDPITKREFDHWTATVAKSQAQQQPGVPVATPDPPTFQRCIAAKQSQPAPPGTPKPNAEQSRTQCQRDYDQLKRQVLQFLINARWIQDEADERDVDVPDEVVRKNFDDQKRQAFPDDRMYRQFLAQSGQTEEDILFRLKLDLLVNEVQKKIVQGRGQVTDEQVRAYYDKNRPQFGKQTLPQAQEQIRQTLRAQGEQAALQGFVGQFERGHREETTCAKGYLVPECKNGPRPPAQPPGGPGGAPPGAQGAPPGSQGAPPGAAPQPRPPSGE